MNSSFQVKLPRQRSCESDTGDLSAFNSHLANQSSEPAGVVGRAAATKLTTTTPEIRTSARTGRETVRLFERESIMSRSRFSSRDRHAMAGVAKALHRQPDAQYGEDGPRSRWDQSPTAARHHPPHAHARCEHDTPHTTPA